MAHAELDRTVLTLPIALWAGWPFFVRGAQSIVNRSPNMWTLIGLGTGAAFVYSVVATVAPQVFPDVVHRRWDAWRSTSRRQR